MASQGRYVPPARGGVVFRRVGRFGPLTCCVALWHNVPRRPRGVLLGFLSPRFSFPLADDFSHPSQKPIFGLAGSRFSFVFLRSLKGAQKNKTRTELPPWVFGSFLCCFP